MEPAAPVISANVVSPRGYHEVADLFRCLAAQTIALQMEVVLCIPRREDASIPPDYYEKFHSIQIVPVGAVRRVGEARVPGIRASAAPLVVFTEEHCFPDAQWAEQLVLAHAEGNWAAVSPAFENANPSLSISWSCFYMEFGTWAAPHAGGPMAALASNNSCYRKERLLELGEELGRWLELESLLHLRMASHGWTFCVAPKARAYHTNVSRRKQYLVNTFSTGQRYSHQRAQDWSLSKKLLFVIGSPLIPALRLSRTLREVKRTGRVGMVRRILFWLSMGLVSSTAGEVLGCLGFAGDSGEAITGIELDRRASMDPRDRIEVPY